MKILITLLFLFPLAACTTLIAKPEVSLKNVKLSGLDSEGVNLDFNFAVRNPNSFDLKLNHYDYDLKIISVSLARGTSGTVHEFLANSTSNLLIPVKIPHSALIDILRQNPDPNAIPYKLQANLNLGGVFGGLNLPITKSGTFAIPEEYQPAKGLRKLGDFLKGLN
jgi:LEA14-like dessication related protein